MLRVLWLTSWYPNKLDAMNGDFIQRHAKATSLYYDVHVIHFESDKKNELKTPLEKQKKSEVNLTEEIYLFKLSSFPVIGKIISFWLYNKNFKKAIKEYISTNGKPDIVHVHVPVKAGIVALWLKKKYDIPFVVTEHWTIYSQQSPDFFLKKSFLFKYFTRKILLNAAAFLPVSKDLGNNIQKLVAPVSFTVVENAVDTNFFNFQQQQENEVFQFIHISTFNYQKNTEAIVKAYKQFVTEFSKSKLLLVGEAGNNIIQFSKNLNIPSANIQFTGLVSYETVAKYLKCSNALVMFSRYENMPCVILESLCCGVPVISSNTGGINEVVNNENGILLEEYSEAALLNAMKEMYKNYEKYNSSKISHQAITKFSYQTIGKKIAQVYRDVLKK